MECHTMSTSTQGLLSGQRGNKHISWLLWPNKNSNMANIQGFKYNLFPWYSRKDFRKLSSIDQDDLRYSHWRIFCLPTTLEGQFSSMQSKNYSKGDEYSSDSSLKEVSGQLIDNDQLKSLLADAERAKLLKKLSEANQHNRYLKRQLLVREEAFTQFKSELAAVACKGRGLQLLVREEAFTSVCMNQLNSEMNKAKRDIGVQKSTKYHDFKF